MRINKYIASSGICSRRKAEELILDKKVKINGRLLVNLATDVKERDVVKVDNKIIRLENKKVYLVLNKPRGYITTVKDEKNRKNVMDLIDVEERVYPVGRLDRNTEGLLIFTNDGDFANSLIHPSKKINKEYIAKVNGEITEEKLTMLRNGVKIDGEMTSKAIVDLIGENKLSIIIHEGKNRQIRKMCETVGLEVKFLKRTRIGGLNLKGIKIGRYIVLSKTEMKKRIGV